jgi:hypothetical protein
VRACIPHPFHLPLNAVGDALMPLLRGGASLLHVDGSVGELLRRICVVNEPLVRRTVLRRHIALELGDDNAMANQELTNLASRAVCFHRGRHARRAQYLASFRGDHVVCFNLARAYAPLFHPTGIDELQLRAAVAARRVANQRGGGGFARPCDASLTRIVQYVIGANAIVLSIDAASIERASSALPYDFRESRTVLFVGAASDEAAVRRMLAVAPDTLEEKERAVDFTLQLFSTEARRAGRSGGMAARVTVAIVHSRRAATPDIRSGESSDNESSSGDDESRSGDSE